jgi:hypothetical protein
MGDGIVLTAVRSPSPKTQPEFIKGLEGMVCGIIHMTRKIYTHYQPGGNHANQCYAG